MANEGRCQEELDSTLRPDDRQFQPDLLERLGHTWRFRYESSSTSDDQLLNYSCFMQMKALVPEIDFGRLGVGTPAHCTENF